MKVVIDKEVLLEMCVSHSRLAQAEYDRNPSYNNEHFAHKAEEKVSKELERLGLMDELFNRMDV